MLYNVKAPHKVVLLMKTKNTILTMGWWDVRFKVGADHLPNNFDETPWKEKPISCRRRMEFSMWQYNTKQNKGTTKQLWAEYKKIYE